MLLSWLLHPFLLSFLALVTLFFFYLLHPTQPKEPNQLPSPWRLPLVGNLHQLGSLPHRSLRRLSQKHGPIILLHLGCVPTVIVSSPAAAQEVMKTHDHAFATRPDSSLTDRLLYGSQDIVFSKYGDYWLQLRRICVVHLLSLKRVRLFGSVRAEEAELLVDHIRSPSGPVNVSEMVVTFTFDVICRMAFGKKYAEEEGGGSRVRTLLAQMSAALGALAVRDVVPWLGWIDWLSGLDARVRKIANQFDILVEKVLKEHESKRYSNHDHDDSSMDFVDILLSLGAANGSDGISLRRHSIKAIILDMFTAGSDTTYVTINWAMAELIKHPRSMKRVQEEIRRIVGPKEMKEETMEGAVYLKAVIKETFRLHPALPLLVPRESMQDTQLLDYRIPKGTRVMINAWAIGRDPVLWEKAEEFWPERFLNDSIDYKGQAFQLIPFGAGRRRCPAMDFAIRTVEFALANLLYHFDWELPEGMTVEEMDMSESPGLTAERKSSLVLVAKPLNHQMGEMEKLAG